MFDESMETGGNSQFEKLVCIEGDVNVKIQIKTCIEPFG